MSKRPDRDYVSRRKSLSAKAAACTSKGLASMDTPVFQAWRSLRKAAVGNPLLVDTNASSGFCGNELWVNFLWEGKQPVKLCLDETKPNAITVVVPKHTFVVESLSAGVVMKAVGDAIATAKS